MKIIWNKNGARGRVVKVLDSRARGLGAILAALVMCRSLGQALNPHLSEHTAVMGTRWNENWNYVNGFSIKNSAAFSEE